MLPVLTADAMRAADSTTISDFGIPAYTLMESAGRAVSAAVVEELRISGAGRDQLVACVCGTGNNGGDGLVAARVLLEAGYSVTTTVVGSADKMSDECAHNLSLLEDLINRADHYDGELILAPVNDDPRTTEISRTAHVIVDALLGTGIKGPARQPASSWIRAINVHGAPVVSVDIPSGLNADSGRADGEVVRAASTVTFGAAKVGHFLNDGPHFSGRLSIAPIGIPRYVLHELARAGGSAYRITRSDIEIPTRDANAHKYSSGLLTALCGSPGLTGAAVMSTTAAMRVGAGAVVCAAGKSATAVLARRLTEVMTAELPENADGLIPDESERLYLDASRRAGALLVGCGVGRKPGTIETVRRILASARAPVVVDADGLFALGESPAEVLSSADVPCVLTPHRGEFERMLGDSVEWDLRIELARQYAREWNCVLVLKGMPSAIGCPDGRVYLSQTANTSFATAGSGDVLAGMIAGFIAQGLQPVPAALTAVYLGGVCAERFGERRAGVSMMATDIIDEVPPTMKQLERA